jgi:tetratricopeptide (TPR) repeat protein
MYSRALDYHKKALEIHEGLSDRVGTAKDYSNIGLVLSDIGNNQEALDYHKKALEIHEGLSDRVGTAKDYGNIGPVLKELNKSTEAVESVDKGLTILLDIEKQTGYHHPLIETLKQIIEG